MDIRRVFAQCVNILLNQPSLVLHLNELSVGISIVVKIYTKYKYGLFFSNPSLPSGSVPFISNIRASTLWNQKLVLENLMGLNQTY